MPDLALEACRHGVLVRCSDKASATLVTTEFGGLVTGAAADCASTLVLQDCEGQARTDPAGLLYHLDKTLIVALQQHRRDLFFVHAAALARDGRAAVFAAPAGTGKSTLALALARRGFEYLSDEIAPIDPARRLVWPYLRALWLKARPPAPAVLPAGAVRRGTRWHVPTATLPLVAREPRPLAALFVLRRSGSSPPCVPLGSAAAAAHLLGNALNALAHGRAGLESAAALAQAVPSYALDTSDLAAACAAVEEALASQEPVPPIRPI